MGTANIPPSAAPAAAQYVQPKTTGAASPPQTRDAGTRARFGADGGTSLEGARPGPAPRGPRAARGGASLNREEKAAVVEGLVERLRASETVIAADFRGMTVKELADLRARLNAAGASFTVVKNTLARRAAGESRREGLLPYLEGPSGLVWVSGDPVVAAKALAETARAVGDRISVKGGVMGDADLPRASVQALAALPPREALVAQLAGGVAAPLTGLASALGNLISGLARALAAVQGQRASEAPAA